LERSTDLALARADVQARSSARSKEHWIVLALAWLALGGAFLVGALLEADPRGFGTHEQLGFRTCLPVALWNVPCPGCGVTTAVTLAMHGELAGSLRTQPFGIVALAGLLAFATWCAVASVRGRDAWHELRRWNWRILGGAIGGLALLAWIYKIALVRGWIG
jgi:hypothetical protein